MPAPQIVVVQLGGLLQIFEFVSSFRLSGSSTVRILAAALIPRLNSSSTISSSFQVFLFSPFVVVLFLSSSLASLHSCFVLNCSCYMYMDPVELSSSSESSETAPFVTRHSRKVPHLRQRGMSRMFLDLGEKMEGSGESSFRRSSSSRRRASFHEQFYPQESNPNVDLDDQAEASNVEPEVSEESWLCFRPGGEDDGPVDLPGGPDSDYMIIPRPAEDVIEEVATVARALSGEGAGPSPTPLTLQAFKFSAEGIHSVLSGSTVRAFIKDYHFPGGVYARITRSNEWACTPSGGEICLYEGSFKAGLRLPFPPFVRELLQYYHLSPGQLQPNSWRIIACLIVLWAICGNGNLTLREFQTMYKVMNHKYGWAHLQARPNMALITGLPSSNKGWEKRFCFVGGDGWEFYPWENVSIDISRVIRKWSPGVSADLNATHDLTPFEIERIRRAEAFPVRHASGLLTEENLRDSWWGS